MPVVQKPVDIKKLDFLSLQQAGEMLQISPKSVQRRCEDGSIRAVKLGKYWRIPKTSLDKLAHTR